jgi:hypothetical protein
LTGSSMFNEHFKTISAIRRPTKSYIPLQLNCM